MLKSKTIVLGITGSIASCKAAELARRLVKEGAKVKVVMSKAATHFITPLTFRTLTKNPVLTSLFEQEQAQRIAHISLADEADLMVIAPATANIIAKAANGIADDPLSTIILSTEAPLIFAPAMNEKMYLNPVTQANLDSLRERGCVIVGPGKGKLSCGEQGFGRLVDLDKIMAAIVLEIERSQDLKGRKVLVTAGGTQENIDPVRYIGNRSSGKMGYAIAREVALRGAEVILVSGSTCLQAGTSSLFPPRQVNFIPVVTTEQMREAVLKYFNGTDIVVKTAAVADFRPRSLRREKIKKGEKLVLELEDTPDILLELSKRKNGQLIVGFAAESKNLIANAKEKLKQKKLDLVVANNIAKPSSGFGTDDIEFVLIDREDNVEKHPLMSKRKAARIIVDRVVDLL